MMHTRLDCLINSMAAVVQQQHRGAYVHKQRRTYISEVFVVNSYPPRVRIAVVESPKKLVTCNYQNLYTRYVYVDYTSDGSRRGYEMLDPIVRGINEGMYVHTHAG